MLDCRGAKTSQGGASEDHGVGLKRSFYEPGRKRVRTEEEPVTTKLLDWRESISS